MVSLVQTEPLPIATDLQRSRGTTKEDKRVKSFRMDKGLLVGVAKTKDGVKPHKHGGQDHNQNSSYERKMWHTHTPTHS